MITAITENTSPTGRDLMRASRGEGHRFVELVGGPLDGRRLVEVEGSPRFSHDMSTTYHLDGHAYRPQRVEGGVLFLVWRSNAWRRGGFGGGADGQHEEA